MLRWAATLAVWLLAPVVGVILVNLPTLVTFSSRAPDAGAMVWGPLGAGFLLILAWSLAAAWVGRWQARRHDAASRVHYGGCGILLLLGLFAPWLYGVFITATMH